MEPVQLSTWTQLRRHFRSWLASLFGAPAESEALSALAGDAPGVSPLAHGAGAGQEALLPGQTQGSDPAAAALQAVLTKHPTVLADLTHWGNDNIVGDPVVEHQAFARMTTTLRRTSRSGLFGTMTQDPARRLAPRTHAGRGGRQRRSCSVRAIGEAAS